MIMHPILFLDTFFLFCLLFVFVIYAIANLCMLFLFCLRLFLFLYMMHLLYTNMYSCMLYFGSADHPKPYANHLLS